MKNEIFIQITSGRGPAECCWVVSQVLKLMISEAPRYRIESEIVQRNIGSEPGTLVSAIVKFEGKEVKAFADTWLGTVLWVGQSLYRRFHKRKNWFIGVSLLDQGSLFTWDEKDISFQTLRSSGPGGQHVNKTESAVRVIHNPSGIQVIASDSRSQLQNKKLAQERLQEKINQWQTNELLKKEQTQWHQHNTLERGNPVRVFKGRAFEAVALSKVCLLFLLI